MRCKLSPDRTASPIRPPIRTIRPPQLHQKQAVTWFSTAEPSNRRRSSRRVSEHRIHKTQRKCGQANGNRREHCRSLQVLHAKGSGGTTPCHGRPDRDAGEKRRSPRVSSRVAPTAQNGRRRRSRCGEKSSAQSTRIAPGVRHAPPRRETRWQAGNRCGPSPPLARRSFASPASRGPTSQNHEQGPTAKGTRLPTSGAEPCPRGPERAPKLCPRAPACRSGNGSGPV